MSMACESGVAGFGGSTLCSGWLWSQRMCNVLRSNFFQIHPGTAEEFGFARTARARLCSLLRHILMQFDTSPVLSVSGAWPAGTVEAQIIINILKYPQNLFLITKAPVLQTQDFDRGVLTLAAWVTKCSLPPIYPQHNPNYL